MSDSWKWSSELDDGDSSDFDKAVIQTCRVRCNHIVELLQKHVKNSSKEFLPTLKFVLSLLDQYELFIDDIEPGVAQLVLEASTPIASSSSSSRASSSAATMLAGPTLAATALIGDGGTKSGSGSVSLFQLCLDQADVESDLAAYESMLMKQRGTKMKRIFTGMRLRKQLEQQNTALYRDAQHVETLLKNQRLLARNIKVRSTEPDRNAREPARASSTALFASGDLRYLLSTEPPSGGANDDAHHPVASASSRHQPGESRDGGPAAGEWLPARTSSSVPQRLTSSKSLGVIRPSHRPAHHADTMEDAAAAAATTTTTTTTDDRDHQQRGSRYTTAFSDDSTTTTQTIYADLDPGHPHHHYGSLDGHYGSLDGGRLGGSAGPTDGDIGPSTLVDLQIDRPEWEEWWHSCCCGAGAAALGRAEHRSSAALMVDWESFVRCLCEEVPTLNANMVESVRYTVDNANTGSVSSYKFSLLMRMFGPFERMASRLAEVANADWFHGYLSSGEVERLLDGADAGTYVVRYSTSVPGAFSVGWRTSAGGCKHVLVESTVDHQLSMEEDHKTLAFDDFSALLRHYRTILLKPLPNVLTKDCTFHGDLGSAEARELLSAQPEGTFLTRFSSKPNHLAISHVKNCRVEHVLVHQLGHRSFEMNGRRFPSLLKLTQHYSKTLQVPYTHLTFGVLPLGLTEARKLANSQELMLLQTSREMRHQNPLKRTVYEKMMALTPSMAEDDEDPTESKEPLSPGRNESPGGSRDHREGSSQKTYMMESPVTSARHVVVGYASETEESSYTSEGESPPPLTAAPKDEFTANVQMLLGSDQGDGASKGRLGFREISSEEVQRSTDIIGRGAYGTVYRAEWRGSDVVVKQLHTRLLRDKHVRAFALEVAVMCAVSGHKNVAEICGANMGIMSGGADHVEMNQGPWLVSPYYSRGSVYDVLQRESDIAWKTLVNYAVGAAAGVLHLHMEKVIHRDLSCRNILVDASNTPKISDFGLARVCEDPSAINMTQTVSGNIYWMAPEAITRSYSFASDSFAFGVCLWELWTKKLPYHACGIPPFEWGMAVREGRRLEIPADCPKEWRELIEHCWKPTPEERPNFSVICSRIKGYRRTLK